MSTVYLYIDCNNMLKLLYDELTIQEKIQKLSKQINNDYKNEEIIIVCLLKGGFIFTSDLVRNLHDNVKIEFIMTSSYGNQQISSGIVRIDLDLKCDIQGKNVIIVDDIVDTGNTIFEIFDIMKGRFPKSLKVCCLLNKEERREKNVIIDYYVFKCPDKFVVGYGMDYAGKYRNLPYIGYIE